MLKSITKFFYETEYPAHLALEQCIVRNLLHILVVTTTLIAQYFELIGTLHPMVVTLGFSYIALSLLWTALVYRYHQFSKAISITGVVTDTFIICFIMYMGAEKEAGLYGLLIFLVLANGLRFGRAHMQFANRVCLAGFISVVIFNDFWQSHLLLSVGNIIWLILIPAHLSNLLIKLESAVIKAEAANEAKTLFIANMSHEIRTPLTSIIGFARSLLNKNLSKEKTDTAIKTILRNGEHLTSIVNDILDISKIESGKLEIEKRNFSIVDITRDIDFLFRDRIESKQLTFTVNYQFPLPETIHSDSLRVKQILINLVSNALKFTETGSININIAFDTSHKELRLSVTDSGIGLTTEQSKEIFSKFTQADSSTTRLYGGTGLGLSISSKLTQLLGGKLWVESEPEKGSTFIFTVPVDNTLTTNYLSELPPLPHDETSTQLSQIKVSGSILLVEDIKDNQLLIKLLLEDIGVTVDIAENGLIALEKTATKTYDLVLLDMQMPVMGGLEALEKMRERGYNSPVVLLTANVIQNEEQKSRDYDCQGFLSKPIDENKLFLVITTYLENTLSDHKTVKHSHTETPSFTSSLLSSDDSENNKYLDMVKTFSDQLHERIQQIEDCLTSKNLKQMHEQLHNLKGLGGNMGFQIITDISSDIEKQLANNKLTAVKKLISDLYKIEKNINENLNR